jgi:DNA-binding MltR family transcriptional regulator
MVKKHLHEGREAFGEFMDEFMTESDRACIILASAEMEARFELLFIKLLDTNAKLQKDLFSFTGPLGNFSSRVKLAYALQLITKEFFDLLEVFRAIRNKITHKGRNVSFADDEIKSDIDRILDYFGQSPKFISWVMTADGLSKDQYYFRSALAFMITMIEHTTVTLDPKNVVAHTCDPEEYILD